MSVINESCVECHYGRMSKVRGKDKLTCHKHAPQPLIGGSGTGWGEWEWPAVSPQDYCGDFKQKIIKPTKCPDCHGTGLKQYDYIDHGQMFDMTPCPTCFPKIVPKYACPTCKSETHALPDCPKNSWCPECDLPKPCGNKIHEGKK
jgi:hypothetical protein